MSDHEDLMTRVSRWLIAKVWLGCMLSGAYAAGRHLGWPHEMLTAAAVAGAIALSLTTLWLPVWTAQRTAGIAVVDVALRVIVWGGLLACVMSLLLAYPAVGAVAGALLLNTAWQTFQRPLKRMVQSLDQPAVHDRPRRSPADSPVRPPASRRRNVAAGAAVSPDDHR